MMKKIRNGLLFLTLISFTSCEKDELGIYSKSKTTEAYSNIKIEDGYLVFDSKESFENEFTLVKNGKSSLLSEIIDQKDFLSLEQSNKEVLILKSSGSNDEDEMDDDDEIVKDPNLQKLLNKGREIVVGGKFYKITNFGMLRCDVEYKNKLRDFVDSNPQFGIIENDETIDQFIEVDEGVELFLPKALYSPGVEALYVMPDPGDGGAGGGSGGSTVDNNSRHIDIANMNTCDESSKTWAGEVIGGILGYSVNCENYYASDKRVKTVFWAQNWFFSSSIGVKVKMQDRTLGIWWGENAQILELGWDMVMYEVQFNLQPTYYSLMLSPEIIETQFKDEFWVDVLKDISEEFKISHGRYPEAIEMHQKLCEQNYKEWTRRAIDSYGDFADLNFYTLKKNKGDILSLLGQYGTKQAYDFIKAVVNKYSNTNNTEVLSNLDKVGKNLTISFIFEDMKTLRVVLPHEAAMTHYGDNKMEHLFDYSSGAVEFGVRLTGDNPIFGVKLYKAPEEYTILKGSKVYGLAKYSNSWRGSFIEKKE